ncbi:PA14 domain protein [Fusarium tjaetaba]|uniref:PA14 domain protein n=1 Tax=Fusarium tjaetaba TaxID=1567544 RepID=A0A8H5VNK4_9HYPO|nr:PA14 domain protein [Fusarium tjaetaba]KAF5629911.1 PA14 domain protein [Fusarium tjaetaba]
MDKKWQDILIGRLGNRTLVNALAGELAQVQASAQSDEESVAALVERFEKFCNENNEGLSEDEVTQLHYISDLIKATKGSVLFVKSIVDYAPAQRTVGTAIVEYYGANPGSLGESGNQSLRLCLFKTRPTETLAGLVKASKLLMPTKASQRLAELVLLSAVEQGINISKQSLPGINKNVDKSNPDVSQESRSHVAALQRLHRLVRDPLNISPLLAKGFLSANSIAATDRDAFVRLLGTGHGGALVLSEDVAITIWQQANLIDLRNSRLWTDFILQREDIPVLALEKQADSDPPTESDGSTQVITMETLFREYDSIEVDEYSSVLSPAAYLVDLLQLLRYSYLNPKDENETKKPSRLLTNFLDRRPDVADLQLSEANTTTLVRYTDLVNETLEAFIAGAAQLDKTTVPADQEASKPVNDRASEGLTSPSTDWRVYASVIQHQKSPPSCAPFNMGLYACREYFQAIGLSLYDLFELFSPLSLSTGDLSQADHKEQAQLIALIETGLERQLAAESLSLSHEEFVMITREAFQSSALISKLHNHRTVFTQEEYAERVGLSSVGEYWGFATDGQGSANDKMAGKVNGINGINNIKDVLLPRSGLQFPELLELLKTEFLSDRLVISVETAKGTFSGKLKDMKLCSTNIQQQDIDSALRIEDCADLLSLIRLWRTLDWKLQDLDNAIVTLSLSRISGEAVPPTSAIDADLLLELAAIKKLAALTSIEVNELIPLWGTMRLSSPNSLYKTLFFQPRYLKQYPALRDFNKEDSQQPTPLIRDLMTPLLLALELTNEDFRVMSQALGIAESAPWNLANISKLYRHNLLRRVLGISLKQYFSLDVFNCEDMGPWQSPRKTWSVVERWKVLQEAGFSNTLLLNAFGATIDTEGNSAYIAGLAAGMLSSLQALNESAIVAPGFNAQTDINLPNLNTICNSVFDSTISEKVTAMLTGTWSVTTECHIGVQLPNDSPLRRKVLQRPGTLTLRGILTAEEHDTLSKLGSDGTSWRSDVDRVYQKSIVPLLALSSSLGSNTIESFTGIFSPTEQRNPSEIGTERLQIIKNIIVAIIDQSKLQAKKDFIFATISSKLDGLIPSTCQSLLEMLSPDDTKPLDLLLSIEKLNSTSNQTMIGPLECFFIAPSLDKIRIAGPSDKHFTLSLGGKEMLASDSSSTALSTTRGQLYALSTAKAEDLKLFSVVDSSGTQSRLVDHLLHPDTVEIVRKVLRILSTAAEVINTMKLSPDELIYFKDHLRFDEPASEGLELLCDHVKARALIKPKSGVTILDLYRAGPLPQGSEKLETICNQLSKSTGFELLRVRELVTACVTAARSAVAIDAKFLIRLNRLMSFIERVNVSAEKMIQWSALTTPEDTTPLYEAAKSLERIVTVRSGASPAKAVENVTMQKRECLVQHLMALATKYGVPADVEGLFEYFLMDVKMGPQQETSRIKQAISTVQLFIQRCLLGLEKKNGIPTTAIKRDTWAWMSKFVLWQANRKVFLYPENWIEPSLRDDKSQSFRSIESLILQSNLNLEVIGSIFRRYIYDTNEIADLQILAYFWESGAKFTGKYHLFARTRTAPYQYYYRVFEVTGVQNDSPRFNWFPWAKIEVEIPALEVDWDGKSLSKAGTYLVPTIYRGRLFLFIPQILLRTRPQAASSVTLKLGETIQPPENQQYWEIKIGWIEYRNGKWSRKEVSSSSLEVEGYKTQPNDPSIPAAARNMPSISAFHFRASARTSPATDKTDSVVPGNNILVLDVYRWFESKPSDYRQIHLGRFELRGTQMIVSDFKDTSTAWKRTTPTRFQQLDHKTSEKEETKFKAELQSYRQYNPSTRPASEQQPLLTLPPHIAELDTDPTQKLTWTVSYNEFQYNGPSALVLERATVSHVDSYFGIIGRDSQGLVPSTQRDTSSVQRLSNDTCQTLMEIVTRSDSLEGLFNGLETVPESKIKNVFGDHGEGTMRELGTANSIYSWELGFHLVLLLMERLYATQQFELALQIASFVFDPRADDEPSPKGSNTQPSDKPLSNLDRCWRFVPFKNPNLRLAGSTRQVVQRLSAGHDKSNDINDWLQNPFNPHAIARGRPSIYMRRFIIKYIQILVAAGDVYFREDTLESLPLALQRYVQASQLFDKRPVVLPRQTRPISKSYNAIIGDLDDFGSAEIDMELHAPYFIQPSDQENASAPFYNGVQGMVRSPYFPVPANPQMAALRDLIDDRFFKIRNSLDINGNFRRLQLFEPPLDPGQLVRSMATGGMASVVANALTGPMPNARFALLLQKAFEMCTELRSMSDAYLVIKEKKDAEALSALRSRQDLAMQNVVLRSKQLARDDLVKNMEILELNRKSQVMRLNYYLALTGESSSKVPKAGGSWTEIHQSIAKPTDDELVMSPEESMEMVKNDEAQELGIVATAIQNTCSILMALPEIQVQAQPMGIGASTQMDPKKIADGMMLVASVIQQEAATRNFEAGRASRKGQLIKQLQDRRLQANQAGYEIMVTDKSIESQRIKIEMAEADISMAKQQIEDLTEMDEHLRNKYTNEALYSWMDTSARKLLYRTYLIAIDAAKSAEKAFLFERPSPSTPESLIESSYWNDSRDGAFAAQNLYLDLKRIESLNMTRKPHDFEVKKSMSLRQIDPWALLRFQDTGKTEFMLPEVLFDYDFPGHYCRRIKSLWVTIPCVVGPYTSVSCTLRLLEHGYRLRQKQNGAAYYPVGSLNSDLRYHTDKVPISAVALSSGFQDTGAFEMEFAAGERYGPFEGAGVVSRWSLELPTKTRQFDYHTVSDVIIHINYTAMNGGAAWQMEAEDAVTKFQESADSQMHVALFDLRDGLTRLSSTGDTPKLTVANVSSLLPFWTRGRQPTFSRFWLVASRGSSLLGDKDGGNLPSVGGKLAAKITDTEKDGHEIGIASPEALMGGTFEVVATDEDTTHGTEMKDIVIELNSLQGKDVAAIRAAQGQRLWLLAEYHVKPVLNT